MICLMFEKDKMTKAEARRAAYESMLVEPDEHIKDFLRSLNDEEVEVNDIRDLTY